MRGRYRLRRDLTAARIAWLTLLADHGPHKRQRGRTAFDCMQLGYTEWHYTFDGVPLTVAEARARFGDDWLFKVEQDWLERITATGREALAYATTKESE